MRKGSCDVVDNGVLVDGTWQKRGFTSYNGAVADISITTVEILDVEVISRLCQGCIQIETFKTKDPKLYEKYRNDHDCSINHDGSAPKMEVTGVERIFWRSLKKEEVR